MKNRVLATSLLASSISLASLPTYATEIRIEVGPRNFSVKVFGTFADYLRGGGHTLRHIGSKLNCV